MPRVVAPTAGLLAWVRASETAAPLMVGVEVPQLTADRHPVRLASATVKEVLVHLALLMLLAPHDQLPRLPLLAHNLHCSA
jgi:hypothetical protein